MEGPIEFTVKKITTEQFAVVEESFSATKEINLFCNFRLGARAEDRAISAFTLCRLEHDKVPFLVIEIGCHFVISEGSWEKITNKTPGRLTLSKGFASHLLSLTVGTARGALHAKTEGSKFNDFPLPTINVAATIKEDVVLDIISHGQPTM